MRLESSFEVPASPERAWELLMDVPRVVPCMPGAELTETLSDSSWKAKMSVKLGPIALAFATDITRELADAAARNVRLAAQARELRGRGGARATIDSTLSAVDGGTRVDIVTDLALSGPVAQYGRGVVEDVSREMIARFARCLEAQLSATPEEARALAEEASHPVSGLSLGLRALGRSISRLLRRLRRPPARR